MQSLTEKVIINIAFISPYQPLYHATSFANMPDQFLTYNDSNTRRQIQYLRGIVNAVISYISCMDLEWEVSPLPPPPGKSPGPSSVHHQNAFEMVFPWRHLEYWYRTTLPSVKYDE